MSSTDANATLRAFTGGRILSMDGAIGEPEVILVADGRIAAAGGRELLGRHPGIATQDLGGRTLLPGFIDAHNHLSLAALHPIWADLSGARDTGDVQSRLRQHADAEPEVAWVRGAGWELEAPLPLTRHDLDALGLDRPVVVAHSSIHQCVVCSRALDVLGIGRTTPDPQGGEITRGPDGLPTGLLRERAWSQAHAVSMAAHHDPERWAELFAARGRSLLREGITAVHDAACAPAAEAVYRTMAAARSLPLSVLVMPHAEAIFMGPDRARLDGPPTGEGDELLRVGPAKLFADGGPGLAFDITVAGTRLQYGMLFEGLADDAERLAERGFAIAVHAMGNVGLQSMIDVFRRIRARPGQSDRLLRVEHATLAAPAQVRALQELDVTAVVQPGFVHQVGTAVESLVPDVERWLPFRDLADAGVPLAASSDDPCCFHEPVRTSARGTTRRTGSGKVLGPEQALGYERWLEAYTAGAAHAGGQSSERGTLTPGKRADLVVLAGALDAENPPQVVETWVGGECVHRAAGAVAERGP